MSDLRIKGQEVEVLISVDNVPQTTITDIKSFDVTFQLEQKSEGYLGETTNRKDDIFNGIKGKIELHFENEDVVTLIESIVNRATRRTPGTKINIKATLNFPNGQRPRMLFPDVQFGEIPMTFGSRTDYGSITLDFEGSDFQRI